MLLGGLCPGATQECLCCHLLERTKSRAARLTARGFGVGTTGKQTPSVRPPRALDGSKEAKSSCEHREPNGPMGGRLFGRTHDMPRAVQVLPLFLACMRGNVGAVFVQATISCNGSCSCQSLRSCFLAQLASPVRGVGTWITADGRRDLTLLIGPFEREVSDGLASRFPTLESVGESISSALRHWFSLTSLCLLVFNISRYIQHFIPVH